MDDLLRCIAALIRTDFGGWDYLTVENASRSIDLLCQRMDYLVRLKEQIDAISG